MKIIKLKGGLGNQMFQYTYAKIIQELTEEEVKLDFSSYNALDKDLVRVPRITKFKLKIPVATSDDIKKICMFNHNRNPLSLAYKIGIFIEEKLNKRYFLEPNRRFIDPESIIEHSYFDGYWQSWRYVERVKDSIVNDFLPNYNLSANTLRTKRVIESQNAVFIGVRRGDYSNEISHYGTFGSSYYQNAMEYISKRVKSPVFYVFSNDIEWCKNNIDWGNYQVIYREQEQQTDDFEELMIMSSCKHAIIINSTYHWWGAKLINNDNKIVCCPYKWFFDEKPIDIIPKGWVRIRE